MFWADGRSGLGNQHDSSSVNVLTYSYGYTVLNTSISDTIAGDISFITCGQGTHLFTEAVSAS